MPYYRLREILFEQVMYNEVRGAENCRRRSWILLNQVWKPLVTGRACWILIEEGQLFRGTLALKRMKMPLGNLNMHWKRIKFRTPFLSSIWPTGI